MKPSEELESRDGVVLVRIPRGKHRELRISWAKLEERSYFSFRLWELDREGRWEPHKRRELTIWPGELPSIVQAMVGALTWKEGRR